MSHDRPTKINGVNVVRMLHNLSREISIPD